MNNLENNKPASLDNNSVTTNDEENQNDYSAAVETSIYALANVEETVVEETSIYDIYNQEKIPVNNNNNGTNETNENRIETDNSIYDNSKTETNVNKSIADNLAAYENYTYSSEEKKLCFVGNDVQDLPTELIYLFGLKALILDISFNYLTDLKDLSQFPCLEELICDNNCISENSHFPSLPQLKLFSCNKNKVKDIHVFIDKVKNYFPKITYLSLLGNEACPNQLVSEENDDYDYSRYRKYVIYRLPELKFLDSYEVTKLEREESSKESLFYDVVSYKDEGTNDELKNSTNSKSLYSPLSDTPDLEQQNIDPKASFGVCRYVYYGKQSEGNRFIKNDDL